MINKFFATILVLTAVLLFSPRILRAQEQICTQVYGGGVVCGAKTEHKPVDTGIGENLVAFGAGLVLVSGILFYFSKKAKAL
mgnify:CR=1 FL=1